MKVVVTSGTGRGFEAMLDKDSGVIEYKNGEISHIVHEKMMGKIVTIMKDAPKEEPEQEEHKPVSEEQSAPVKKAKSKSK